MNYALTNKKTGEIIEFNRRRRPSVTMYRLKHDAKVAAVTTLIVFALV